VRQHWEPRARRVSPGTGRKIPGSGASFAPFRGWLIGELDPGLCALGYYLWPSGLCAEYAVCGLPLGGAAYPGCGQDRPPTSVARGSPESHPETPNRSRAWKLSGWQMYATLPRLFNALYWLAEGDLASAQVQ
jgi:hypothetical protein